jgi:hypothetical protein
VRRFGPFAAAVALLLAACSRAPEPGAPASPASRPAKALAGGFADVTAKAGIAFLHEHGARGGKLLPETMGSGAAFLDWNGDGRPDVFLVSSGSLEAAGPSGAFALLVQNDRGVFEDLTGRATGSPAGVLAGYPMGVSVADYDGDGDDDVYVTGVRRNGLLRNDGGTLVDVAKDAGVEGGAWRDRDGVEHPAWSTASLWCDYDGDGDLDLFVAGYVQWTRETDIFTSLDGVTKAFTTPDRYTGLPVRLYRNRGDGTFDDATGEAGLLPHLGKGLGLATWDLDGNGHPDVVVANDTRPNFVFMNQGGGRFTEEGLAMRIAYDEHGRARAGMGIDIADYANDGVPGIAIGNFAGEPMSLYRAGKGGFDSTAEQAGVAAATTPLLAFGVRFADLDLDGIQDLVVVNGHIEPDVAKFVREQTHAQKALLFLGAPGARFVDATSSAGPDFAKPRVARGLAIADYDGDGDLDLLVTENGGPAALLQNRLMETAPAHWLRVALRGNGKNTRAIGASVTLVAGGLRQTRMVRTGSSYLSQGDVFPTFGLGTTARVDELRVRWPDGRERAYPVDAVDRTITIAE